MRYVFTSSFCLFFSLGSLTAVEMEQQLPILNSPAVGDPVIRFTENKGQVHDLDQRACPDILFGGTDGHLAFHLRTNGISYQLSKAGKKSYDPAPKKNSFNKYLERSKPYLLKIYRLDMDWLHANSHPYIKKEKASESFDNFYTVNCPDGALEVRSYEEVIYEDLYEGINVRWHQDKGHLKYDYLVAAGADYRNIQLGISGAIKVTLKPTGELKIRTPFGDIVEAAPLVIQNGKVLPAKWNVTRDEKMNLFLVSFEIEQLDHNLPFVIDPVVRNWGTFYGGSTLEFGLSVTTDQSGNVYCSGLTTSATTTNIATTGSHQQTYTLMDDAFLSKFNAAGVRLWGTYYGGSGNDEAYSCTCDPTGNVYIAGITDSNTGTVIATPASHQPVYGGGAADAFLAKFNSSGVRQWATYYGGTANDQGYSCSADANGNIYMSGYADSNTGTVIATPGSHQPIHGGGGVNDAFLVKFDAAGTRLWATYYGGTGSENGNCCFADPAGNVYMTGASSTSVTTIIATPSAHQTSYNGSYDAFLVKFDGTGVRQWATYYGTSSFETAYTCYSDASGSVYFGGWTQSTSGSLLATTGAHQTSPGGGISEAYIAKFNSAGVRQWSSYYGGTGQDIIQSCFSDASGNVYFSGSTNSTNGTVIATPGNHQPTSGGGDDGFFAKFDAAGVRQWGTYYGDASSEEARASTMDLSGNLYLAGTSYSTAASGTRIATPLSHQPTNSGGYDAMLVQFSNCNVSSPANTTPSANLVFCVGGSATLQATGTGTISWYNSGTGTTVLGTGTSYTTPVTNPGTYTFYADATTCAPSFPRTAFVVTVNPLPSLVIVPSGSVLCSGQSVILTGQGASTYTWLPNITTSTLTVTPASNTTYSLSGTNTVTGCMNTAVITITVLTVPTLSATASSYTICKNGSTTLTANGSASSFTWFPGNTTVNPLTVSPATNTNYTVTAGPGSCTKSAVISISVHPVSAIILQGGSNPICEGETTTLSASGSLSYTWNPGGTGASITISPLSTTQYTITGYDANNCQATAMYIQQVDACTDITNPVSEINWSVFPNPSSGKIFVKAPYETTLTITIVNALGQAVYSGEIQGYTEIDLSRQPAGLYLIKIGSQTHKLVKE